VVQFVFLRPPVEKDKVATATLMDAREPDA
jgi:hypothetical protein